MANHPLDPMTAEEFSQTAAILRRDQGVTETWRFASIELAEPPKADVKAWRSGDADPAKVPLRGLQSARQPGLRSGRRSQRRMRSSRGPTGRA